MTIEWSRWALVGLAMSACAASASAQESTNWARHGDWIVEKYGAEPESLPYAHCATERFYGTENGIRITLGFPSKDKDGVLGIEFVGEGSMTLGDRLSVSYHFDDPSNAVSGTAKAAPPDNFFMRVEEDEGPGSFDALANGKTLVIQTRGAEWRYDLAGSNPAMKSLVECAHDAAGIGSGGPRDANPAQRPATRPRDRDVAVAPPPPPPVATPPAATPPPAASQPPPATRPSRRKGQTVACPAPGSERSSQSGEAAITVFINRSDRVQNVYWLDFAGERKHYKTLQPSERHRQRTFAGHVWLVVGADGACQDVHRSTPGRQRLVIR
jgi:hypothetical protein